MSSCACINNYDYDAETCQWNTTEFRKARKPHTCGECEHIISPGEKYERITGVWDGSWDHHITCLSCVDTRTAFFCNSGWMFNHVWDDVYEHIKYLRGEGLPWEKIGKLPDRAKNLIFDEIQKVWDKEAKIWDEKK